MFITIAATVTVVSAAVLPAVAEIKRVIDDHNNPMRLLAIPTRRSQVQVPVEADAACSHHG